MGAIKEITQMAAGVAEYAGHRMLDARDALHEYSEGMTAVLDNNMAVMRKRVEDVRSVHAVQQTDGTWDYSQYMCGMANGLELALAILEGRKPNYRQLEVEVNKPAPTASGVLLCSDEVATDVDEADPVENPEPAKRVGKRGRKSLEERAMFGDD